MSLDDFVTAGSPRVRNYMEEMDDFVAAWTRADHDYNIAQVSMGRSSLGNINTVGSEASYDAPSLTPHHVQFSDSIEPGIRRLVESVIRLGWRTYTSCEGHLPSGPSERGRQRHVGLIPRDHAEEAHMIDVLGNHAGRIGRGNGASTLRAFVHFVEGPLRTLPAVDLYFWRLDGDWRGYLADSDVLRDRLCDSLERGEPWARG